MILEDSVRRSCVNITIISDDQVEENERFIVSIKEHPDDVILRQESTTVIILDATGEYNMNPLLFLVNNLQSIG